MTKERKRCKYPMSQFYIYEDEVPPNTRVSTCEDCITCDDMAICVRDDIKHCLITEPDEQRI